VFARRRPFQLPEELDLRRDAELAVDRLEVGADRGRRDEQAFGDVAVALAVRIGSGDLVLSTGQTVNLQGDAPDLVDTHLKAILFENTAVALSKIPHLGDSASRSLHLISADKSKLVGRGAKCLTDSHGNRSRSLG
jgi:hypothetical protein